MKKLPIAYGYMRVREDADDQELQLMEDGMRSYAGIRGLRLTHTHYEWGPGIEPYRFVRRLLRDDVHHVIVPSLAQITEHPLMQSVVSESITLGAGALLYEAGGICGQVDVS